MTGHKVGSLEIQTGVESVSLINMVLWGPSKTGKSTLAATAPGNKLWFQFDPGASDPVAHRDDVFVLPFNRERDEVCEQFRTKSSIMYRDLEKVIADYDTLVFDSTTTYNQKIFEYCIQKAKSLPAVKNAAEKPDLLSPGYAGYGVINGVITQTIEAFQFFCESHGKHCIFIMHEDVPKKDKEGHIIEYNIMLGSNIPTRIAPKLGEVWHLASLEAGAKITRRVYLQTGWMKRSPMGTRMLSVKGRPEFTWDYDPETDKGIRIEEIYKRWIAGGKKKLPLPTLEDYR